MTQNTLLAPKRLFTKPGSKAYEDLQWEKRESKLVNPSTGEIVFEQNNLEFPVGWSQNAINIVAQKYFTGTPGTKDREHSLKQLINRVVETVAKHGLKEGYFADEAEVEVFCEELRYILATQRASFNSPVWFNIGVPDRSQQASACFILGVEDTMSSILNWYTEEGVIFKGGSGAGVNLSRIRSSKELLSGSGGYASGPVSFMRGADASAGTIKSGGKTRRAAKMVILDVEHPDIEEFIWCKAREERKSRALTEAGFDMSLNGADAFSIQYQNANNSVRVTDDFMHAVEQDADWSLNAVTTGKAVETVKARELFHQIAEAAWECADPGLQFDTTINKWHTTPNAGRINGSNPCSEYMHLDNSACNLASINLLKYLKADGSFDTSQFKHTVEIVFTAQEILVGYSEYPTESIAKNARAYRELGMGYANLGALLMAQGLPYDSDEGRAQAASITALMTGHAYATSARIARRVGPFAGYHKDRENMNKIIKLHRQAVSDIDASMVREDLLSAATTAWDEAVELSELYGVRNSQATVLAPTGTIGLMMDCDTTGIEPDLGLVKLKTLVGGGSMTIVNQTIPQALHTLGYNKAQIKEITEYIDVEKTIVGAPHLKQKDLPVFACSMGDNPIHYLGHIKMMGAVQPFLSGAISKTVNMPENVSVEEVEQLHMESWKLGLKAVAIYRDNCKVAQPLKMAKKDSDTSDVDKTVPLTSDGSNSGFILKGAVRKKMPKVRNSKTFSFKISGSSGYVTVGEYEDGNPGEVFMSVAKQGSTLAGIMDAFAISVSHGLQYGVPLKSYVKAFINMSFAPAGITDDTDIRTASSIVDYIFRKLAGLYLSFDDRLELGLASIDDMEHQITDRQVSLDVDISTTDSLGTEDEIIESSTKITAQKVTKVLDTSGPMCFNCGNQTQRSGSCYVCTACGTTTGCS
ncbi:vitamin B12-dependent ribonucleotide reductase [Candidatus Saccharibacteria bacterium]|nr:vitamin B12-dependent ribonucleotide reductase [Candidatus Saccharibacteria bacterium]MCB9821301.1 vitamin B12-dependent ribonucleotide reductase [Candidatus Nomurabacteria bacterium]